MGCAASSSEGLASDVQSPVTGVVVDCGSGHASVLWYESTPEGGAKQIRRSRLHADADKPFKLAMLLIADAVAAREQLCLGIEAEIAAATGADQEKPLQHPSLLFVGATGGLREALLSGTVPVGAVDDLRSALEGRFSPSLARVRLVCLTGEQEALWEACAARSIWRDGARMFPGGAAARFGLFSGGGQSMQVQVDEPRSWPFSTWCDAMDEAQGASADAWRDDAMWCEWEANLLEQVRRAAPATPAELLGGAFVLTAMNEVACKAAGLSETPIVAAEAVVVLREALALFRRPEAETGVSASAVGGHAEHSARAAAVAAFLDARRHYKYNVARVTAMHLCRLAIVLEHLFAGGAQLFAPDPKGSAAHCEWALGAFEDEAARIKAKRLSTVQPFAAGSGVAGQFVV